MNLNNSNQSALPFWEKPLASLNPQQWEQLCDGCGRCCLKKLTDESTDKTWYTRVICRFFDEQSSRCGCYSTRTELVPDCLVVSNTDIAELPWMPDTCAYRLRHEGKPLFDWHPLIAGNRDKMEQSDITVSGKVISEEFVHEAGLEEHVIRWVNS